MLSLLTRLSQLPTLLLLPPPCGIRNKLVQLPSHLLTHTTAATSIDQDHFETDDHDYNTTTTNTNTFDVLGLLDHLARLDHQNSQCQLLIGVRTANEQSVQGNAIGTELTTPVHVAYLTLTAEWSKLNSKSNPTVYPLWLQTKYKVTCMDPSQSKVKIEIMLPTLGSPSMKSSETTSSSAAPLTCMDKLGMDDPTVKQLLNVSEYYIKGGSDKQVSESVEEEREEWSGKEWDAGDKRVSGLGN